MSVLIKSMGHRMDILKNESFMNTYYDPTTVPKEAELDMEEFRCRLESWYPCHCSHFMYRATYNMFTGVKMRRNGDWFATYDSKVEGEYSGDE